MNRLSEYRDTRGLTNEQVADELSALLGKKIGAPGVNLWANRDRPPKAWAAALGLDDEAPVTATADASFFAVDEDDQGPPAGQSSSTRSEDGPPKAPAGARHAATSPGGDYSLVRDRIAKAYAAIGAGATMVTHNEGYGAVADLYKDDLANAWIAAARENQNVAKIVAFMESGGPVGELVVAHVILVLGFVYVSGRAPALQAIYGRELSAYHASAHAQAVADEAAAMQNGTAPEGEPVAAAA